MGCRTKRYGPCCTSPRSAGTMPKLRPNVANEAAQPSRATACTNVGNSCALLSCPASFRKDSTKVPEMASSPSSGFPTLLASRLIMKSTSAVVLITTSPTVEVDGGKPEFSAWLNTRNSHTKAGSVLPGLINARMSCLRIGIDGCVAVVMFLPSGRKDYRDERDVTRQRSPCWQTALRAV